MKRSRIRSEEEAKNFYQHLRVLFDAAGVDFGDEFTVVKVNEDHANMPKARSSDPITSKRAVPSEMRRNSQKYRILCAFRNRELTSEQAGERTGVKNGWRRVSELKQMGFIHPVGEELGSCGTPVERYVITPAGREMLSRVKD